MAIDKTELWEYKGNFYQIVNLALLKSGEDWKNCIVYQSTNPTKGNGWYVRDQADFYKKFKRNIN